MAAILRIQGLPENFFIKRISSPIFFRMFVLFFLFTLFEPLLLCSVLLEKVPLDYSALSSNDIIHIVKYLVKQSYDEISFINPVIHTFLVEIDSIYLSLHASNQSPNLEMMTIAYLDYISKELKYANGTWLLGEIFFYFELCQVAPTSLDRCISILKYLIFPVITNESRVSYLIHICYLAFNYKNVAKRHKRSKEISYEFIRPPFLNCRSNYVLSYNNGIIFALPYAKVGKVREKDNKLEGKKNEVLEMQEKNYKLGGKKNKVLEMQEEEFDTDTFFID